MYSLWKKSPNRFPFLDQIRGFAVLLMIIFHFFYDLRLFHFNQIDFKNNPFWFGLPRFIVFLFMLSVGMSLALVHHRGIRWKKFLERWLILVFFAAMVTLSTYFLFPTRWVYFGTLHSIAVCSLLGLLFIDKPHFSIMLNKIDLPFLNMFYIKF